MSATLLRQVVPENKNLRGKMARVKRQAGAGRTKRKIGRKGKRMGQLAMEAQGDTVVERVIGLVGGKPSELARRLSEYADEEITRQTVNGWRVRGIFPRDMIVHVAALARGRVSLEELLMAKPRPRHPESPVDRAIEKVGGTPGLFADELSKHSGRKITRQMVNNWQVHEQFPRDVVLDVHLLTGIVVEDLIRGRRSRA